MGDTGLGGGFSYLLASLPRVQDEGYVTYPAHLFGQLHAVAITQLVVGYDAVEALVPDHVEGFLGVCGGGDCYGRLCFFQEFLHESGGVVVVVNVEYVVSCDFLQGGSTICVDHRI